MKNLLKLDIKTLLIIVLTVIILSMKMCSGDGNKPSNTIKIDGKKYEVLKNTIDTQYVPIFKYVDRPGKDIYHESIIYQQLPVSFDTMGIIREYFAKNIYKDTLILDDFLGYISVVDTIQKNNILNRTWTSNVNKITVKETIIVKEPLRNQIFFGFNTTLNKPDIFGSVGAITTLKTKNEMMYNFGFGVGNSSNGVVPYIGLGIQWKIKIKKN